MRHRGTFLEFDTTRFVELLGHECPLVDLSSRGHIRCRPLIGVNERAFARAIDSDRTIGEVANPNGDEEPARIIRSSVKGWLNVDRGTLGTSNQSSPVPGFAFRRRWEGRSAHAESHQNCKESNVGVHSS